ncbi:hypothetical protein H696_02853 [Fonticula alba]|uniref:Membrane transporter protein n=1 Tax=Fonticula alba TaxID=691883 RepID=A0A058Z8E5_FONAL|nr:hypothetical protein H696_02853 [Fonticula alba]KCV70505.1 hypothetical protein H696_02853 [Fonticula alba]|eukprot:XP_009495021.1 hypothetical protein H696_02853 [Fonticula alba]
MFSDVDWKYAGIFGGLSLCLTVIMSIVLADFILNHQDALKSAVSFVPLMIAVQFLIRGCLAVYRKRKAKREAEAAAADTEADKEAPLLGDSQTEDVYHASNGADDEQDDEPIVYTEKSSLLHSGSPSQDDLPTQGSGTVGSAGGSHKYTSDMSLGAGASGQTADEDLLAPAITGATVNHQPEDGEEHPSPEEEAEAEHDSDAEAKAHPDAPVAAAPPRPPLIPLSAVDFTSWASIWAYLVARFYPEQDTLFGPQSPQTRRPVRFGITIVINSILGIVSGTLYAGGGMFYSNVLVNAWDAPVRLAAGTGCLIMTMVMFAMTLTFPGREGMDDINVLYLLLLSLPFGVLGSLFGARLALRISDIVMYFLIVGVSLTIFVVIAARGIFT